MLLGRDMVREAAEIEGFPEELLICLEHAILSHHGKRGRLPVARRPSRPSSSRLSTISTPRLTWSRRRSWICRTARRSRTGSLHSRTGSTTAACPRQARMNRCAQTEQTASRLGGSWGPRVESGSKFGLFSVFDKPPHERPAMKIMTKSFGTRVIMGALAGCAGDEASGAGPAATPSAGQSPVKKGPMKSDMPVTKPADGTTSPSTTPPSSDKTEGGSPQDRGTKQERDPEADRCGRQALRQGARQYQGASLRPNRTPRLPQAVCPVSGHNLGVDGQAAQGHRRGPHFSTFAATAAKKTSRRRARKSLPSSTSRNPANNPALTRQSSGTAPETLSRSGAALLLCRSPNPGRSALHTIYFLPNVNRDGVLCAHPVRFPLHSLFPGSASPPLRFAVN